MGKIRVATLGDEELEKEQRKKAELRRAAKSEKKGKKKEEEQQEQTIKTEQKEEEQEQKQKKQEQKQKKSRERSKRYQDAAKRVDKTKLYPIRDAVSLVKQTSITRFDGTVEAHINLSLQALGGKPDYRGSVIFPHGTGKNIRVAIADDNVINQLEQGLIEFDILVAHPSMMPKLAKFARTLGPKGLMPNPKNGTVHLEPEKRAEELSKGEVYFKTEPNNPIVHLRVGKVSFDDEKLVENIQALIKAIGKQKIVKATLSATMGPGVKLDLSSV